VSLKPLSSLPKHPLTIERALLSVSDKKELIPLAKSLHEANVELISTGGTAQAIKEAGLEVTDVSELTGFRECLDGRVKTLHPHVHGGILARTSHQPDLEELKSLDIHPIQLVVVNLYPFEKTVSAEKINIATATEYIDIGGPTMIRAAAKNFAHVCVLTSPGQYSEFIQEFNQNRHISFKTRKLFARDAFNHTAKYDAVIANYFNNLSGEHAARQINISAPLSQELRYGENPHQKAAVYGNQKSFIDCFHGKKLSYNNYLDVDAALAALYDFKNDEPTCAIIKHTVPCGIAVASKLSEAYKKALSTDTVSPFGGIVAVNQELDMLTAREIDKIFTEIIIAPAFSDDAAEFLKQKKNRRLIKLNKSLGDIQSKESFRSIFGGLLHQDIDVQNLDENHLNIVTRRKPEQAELKDLMFAWKVVKHVKSNAIVYASDRQTLGIGTGQTSRVDASEIAIRKARKEGLSLIGSVVASDAFFPFADGVEAAAKAGATAVIQPGGSIRDDEVIQKADEYNLAMIFTGNRHFKH